MPVYRLVVEYDGSKFKGWQRQPSARTVQGALLTALRAATDGQPIGLQGAGRTDAGVHALRQVASLRCQEPVSVPVVLERLERDLPPDLAVLEMTPAAESFHARHDALSRSYRYQITRRRSAFGKRYTWWVTDDLDVRAMADGAARFIGRHDYRAFSKGTEPGDSTIVEVRECRVVEVEPFVLFRISASHFLRGQVRRMVGSLVTVGIRSGDPQRVSSWLHGEEQPPPLAAPAAGLFLEDVRYPGDTHRTPPLLPVAVPWWSSREPGDRGGRRATARGGRRGRGTPSK